MLPLFIERAAPIPATMSSEAVFKKEPAAYGVANVPVKSEASACPGFFAQRMSTEMQISMPTSGDMLAAEMSFDFIFLEMVVVFILPLPAVHFAFSFCRMKVK